MTIILAGEHEGLSHFAATELASYLKQLFQAEAAIVRDAVHGTGPVFYLDAGVRSELEEQEYVIEPVHDGLRLSGYDAQALLWAVYTLVESWGVLFAMDGDVLPKNPQFQLPRAARKYTPNQKMRIWTIYVSFLWGTRIWSVAQQKRFMLQLAKNRYNGVFFQSEMNDPFYDLEIDGVRRESFENFIIPLTDQTVGREHFPDFTHLRNFDFYPARTFRDAYEIGQRYTKEVFDYAKWLGFQITMAVMPYNIPHEFARFLEKPVESLGYNGFSYEEGGDFFNRNHMRITEAIMRSHFEHYPQADVFTIMPPEFGNANRQQLDQALRRLDKKYGLLSRFDVDAALARQKEYALCDPARAESDSISTLMSVDSMHQILERSGFLRELSARGKRVGLISGLNSTAVMEACASCLWDSGVYTLNMDYSSVRVVRELHLMDGIDARALRAERGIDTIMTVTIQDDNIGPFPQMCVSSLDTIFNTTIRKGLSGFMPRVFGPGDIDPMVMLAGKKSWDVDVCADGIYAEYARKLAGEEYVGEVRDIYRMLEFNTVVTDTTLEGMHALPGTMSNRLFRPGSGRVSEHWQHLYVTYDGIVHRLEDLLGRIPSDAPGRAQLEYMLGRARFSKCAYKGYMRLLAAYGLEEREGLDALLREYEEVLAEWRKGLEYMKEVARNESDWGLLGVYSNIFLIEPQERIRETLKERQKA